MRSTTFATLLLPLILPFVLAAPTPVGQDDINSSALEVRDSDDCGEDDGSCYFENIGDDDKHRLPDSYYEYFGIPDPN